MKSFFYSFIDLINFWLIFAGGCLMLIAHGLYISRTGKRIAWLLPAPFYLLGYSRREKIILFVGLFLGVLGGTL
jgi:hypothetical protein